MLPRFAGRGHDYPIDEIGRLGLKYGIYPDAPYTVAQWLFPATDRHDLIVERLADGETWPVAIDRGEIIRDADLEREEDRAEKNASAT